MKIRAVLDTCRNGVRSFRKGFFDRTTSVISSGLGIVAPYTAARYHAKRVLLKSVRERNYDAAQRQGPNQLWSPQNRSGDSEIRIDYQRVLARARDLARNDPYVAGAIQTFVGNVNGQGITPQPLVKKPNGELDVAFNSAAESLFKDWAEWSGFYEKQDLVVKHLVSDGECLGLFIIDRTVPKGLPPFNIQMLECDQLAEIQGDAVLSENGNVIRRGIEFDSLWRPQAYHLWDYHPGDLLPLNFNYNARRVPASDVVHPFRRDRISQTRGISWLAAIIMRMFDLSEYQDFEMIGAKVAAAFAVFIKTPFGDVFQPPGFNQTAKNNDSKLEYIEAGRIERLLPGEDIEVAAHTRPALTYSPFVQTTLRGGASGIGLSYETFSADYSQSTYSSARSALLEERRKYRKCQQIECKMFNRPAWGRFLELSIIGGLLQVPVGAYLANPARYSSVDWHCPGWEWVDPLKDSAAAEMDIAIGVGTRAEILASQGKDWRQVFEQLGEEKKYADELGIDITPAVKRETIPGQSEGDTPPAVPAAKNAA